MEIDLNEPSRPQLAALFGVSSRWIGELRSKGDLPTDGATWAENLEAWLALKGARVDRGDGDLDLDEQRARLAKEQADAKEMDNAERRKELASLPDMTVAMTGVIALAMSRLMQVPALVAKSDNSLRQRIENAIVDALEELSAARVEEMSGGLDADDARDEGDE